MGVGGMNYIMYTTNGGQPFNQILNNNEKIPKEYELFQNYPNPFNPFTNIKYQVSRSSKVKLTVFNIL